MIAISAPLYESIYYSKERIDRFREYLDFVGSVEPSTLASLPDMDSLVVHYIPMLF